MKREKYNFKRTYTWTSHPDHPTGESTTGKLPKVAILPDGTRVPCDLENSEIARWEGKTYHPGEWAVLARDEEGNALVSHKFQGGGDNPSRPHGRSVTLVTILAPPGTKFEMI